jgi:hypothetical protein
MDAVPEELPKILQAEERTAGTTIMKTTQPHKEILGKLLDFQTDKSEPRIT